MPSSRESCTEIFKRLVADFPFKVYDVKKAREIETELLTEFPHLNDRPSIVFSYLKTDQRYTGLVTATHAEDIENTPFFAGEFIIRIVNDEKRLYQIVDGVEEDYLLLSEFPSLMTLRKLEESDATIQILRKRFPLKGSFSPNVIKEREEFITSFLNTGKAFSNSLFYDYLEKDLRKGQKLVKRWLSAPFDIMLAKSDIYRTTSFSQYQKVPASFVKKMKLLRQKRLTYYEYVAKELGNKYTLLLADPAIVNRFDEFRTFYKGLSNRPESPFELRNLFSHHLGNVTLYRVLALDESAVQEITQTGLKNKYSLSEKDRAALAQSVRDQIRLDYFEGQYSKGPFGEFSRRINAQGIFATSYTQFPEYGVYATGFPIKVDSDAGLGNRDSIEAMSEMKKYIFEVEVPALSVSNGSVFRHQLGVPDKVVIDDKEYEFFSPEVESFMFDDVTPEQIKSIKEVNRTGPMNGSWVYKNGDQESVNAYDE